MLGAFYALSEVLLAMARRSRSGAQARDRYSLRILWTVIVLAVAASILAANNLVMGRLPYAHLSLIGLCLFVGGIVLRWYSIIHLGRFFTVNVAIASGHRLIDSGPYRFLRHPSYTGALLAFVGYGLCLRNVFAFLLLVVPVTIAFMWRIHVEEQALVGALGDEYRNFAARTKRLIPFVY
jgi:protein-S-isoprenylcysteine O-methyltransferase